MKDIKFIYWFAYYNDSSPSVRYRAKYPLGFMRQEHGVESALIIPGYHPKKMAKFLFYYCSALFFRKRDSVIVVQRVHSNYIYANLLKFLITIQKRYTVYDLDDADYLYLSPKTIYAFAKKCSHITAGSRAIGKHLSVYNNKIVHTSSPTPDLNISKEKRNKIFTIGWIGGFGGDHKKGLIDLVFPAIKELEFTCVFEVMGVFKKEDETFIRGYFNGCDNISINIPNDVNWRDEIEVQNRIKAFDVGIATLLDNEVQRSKSGIKAKQYLNNGVPVLATKLPENDCVVKDGVNGFFCSDSSDFKRKLELFKFMDEDEYYTFSKNARESRLGFDLEKYYSDFSKIK